MLHRKCPSCGGWDVHTSSKVTTYPFARRLWLLATLRKLYRCEQCHALFTASRFRRRRIF